MTYGSTYFPKCPTNNQYRSSAALVSWFCVSYGLPVDRTHMVGHAEADTHTTHT